MRKTEGCLLCTAALTGKGLGNYKSNKLPTFCSISIFSISELCICGGGETKRPSEPHQVLLLLPLLWRVNHTPYDELCRPKRSHLPTPPKNVNFFNATLPTALILLNLGCPPPPQKGRTSVYNGLGNKNPIRDYQIHLRK